MAKAYAVTRQCGNGLRISLPPAVVCAAKLYANQRVYVSAQAGQVRIIPVEEAALTLEQRLALFDPVRHGGE